MNANVAATVKSKVMCTFLRHGFIRCFVMAHLLRQSDVNPSNRGNLVTVSTGPGSQTSLREANAARVIDAVRTYGSITQVELTAVTGLSQATISNIVKRLTNHGVLKTEGTIRSGRRAQLVSLVRSSGVLAGVQVGRRGLRVAVSDFSLAIQEQKSLPLPANHRSDTTLDRASMLIVEIIEAIGSNVDELSAVGITLAAPVDPESGYISIPGLLPGWEDLDVAEILSRRLNRPVAVDNDANAAALAESRLGALRGVDNGIYVRASYSTGAGVLIRGDIHRGARGVAGEIGHVQVEPTGLICQCGARGCLNTVVGADVLVESLRLSRGYSSLSDVIRGANDSDPGCRQVITDAGAQIGKVLADYAVSFGPTHVVVGGELATMGELLLAPLRDALAGRPLLGESVVVEPAHLGQNAEIYGSLALALEQAKADEGVDSPTQQAARTAERVRGS